VCRGVLKLKILSVPFCVLGDSGSEVSILGDDNINHCERKTFCEHVSNSDWLLR